VKLLTVEDPDQVVVGIGDVEKSIAILHIVRFKKPQEGTF
jgi:hypothetical protein